MKTYTYEEAVKFQYPVGKNPKLKHKFGYWRIGRTRFSADWMDGCQCNKVQPFSISGLWWFYEDCENCLGKGRPPIPLEELK